MYTPEGTPGKDNLPEYIYREFLRISAEFGLIAEGRYWEPRAAAPVKPREGQIVVADGTNWNPGAGKGAYEYRSGAWAKL
jgi:hypothetical protein